MNAHPLRFLLITGLVAMFTAPIAAAIEAPVDTSLTGFSWIETDHLAAMACPGGRQPLAEDLAFLESARIRVLVSLTTEPVPADSLTAHGMSGLHLPVEDFTPPTLEQIAVFVAEVERAQREDYAVGIHCTAGLGRTGTMIASLFVSQGLTAADAIAEIRRLRPGSVETPAQEARIAEFADLCRQAQ